MVIRHWYLRGFGEFGVLVRGQSLRVLVIDRDVAVALAGTAEVGGVEGLSARAVTVIAHVLFHEGSRLTAGSRGLIAPPR